jgi:hypothetical protein
MKMKKCGAYAALAAVLLISAVLITNCVDPINPGGLFAPKDKDQPTSFVPPPGKGYVMLNFGAGRTIRPPSSAYVANVGAFNHFDVVFTATSGGTSDSAVNKTYTELDETPFVLEDGTYTIAVWAYNVAHPSPAAEPAVFHPEAAVAYGVMTGVEIDEGVGTPATITLSEIKTAAHSGTGTFAWHMTSNPTISKVELTIKTYPDGDVVEAGPSGSEIEYDKHDITSTLVSSVILDPGYYSVDIDLTGATGRADKTIREILHVYQGMTSPYGTAAAGDSKELPTLVRTLYNVTFTYGDARTTDGRSKDGTAASDSVTFNTALAGPTDAQSRYVLTTAPTYDDTLAIEHWYTEAPVVVDSVLTWNPAKIWNFATTILRDTNLYARWNKVGYFVTVTFTPSSAYAPTIIIRDITSTDPGEHGLFTGFISVDNKAKLEISFSNSGTIYDSIVWDSDDIDLSEFDDESTIIIDFASNANINLLRQGDFTINLTLDHLDPYSPESVEILFEIK